MIKLLVCFILSHNLALGQELTTTELRGKQNIYNDAISRYLISTSVKSMPIFDTLFIQQDDVITDSLMTLTNNCNFLILDGAELSGRIRNTGSFMLHRIFPLSFHEGIFFINIVPFRVTLQKEVINLAYGGTYRVEYRFNDKVKEFIFKKAKLLSF